jgi:streptogramin lyase
MVTILPHVFISYSRKQFYFAESLVYYLDKYGEEYGVRPWLDVQRLEPGTSWQHALEEGLDSCSGLVLIASRAALSSDYVRTEWQRALAANKPIYVALFEAVRLPPELQNASIIDCRKNFVVSVGKLMGLICTGKSHRDRLPKGNLLRLPTRLPSVLWWIMGVLWSQVLAFLLLTIMLVQNVASVTFARPAGIPSTIAFGIAWVVIAGYVYYFTVGFTFRRRIGLTGLRIWVLVFTLVLNFLLWGLLIDDGLETVAASLGVSLTLMPRDFSLFSQLLSIAIFWFFLLASVIGFSIFVTCLIVISQDLVRWLATGTVSGKLRVTLRPSMRRNIGQENSSERVVKTCRLHYDPVDEPLVAEIRSVLGKNRRLRLGSDEQADIHIAILSNKTSQPWLNQLVRSLPNLICMVATSIRLPSDETVVRQTQWVDYRSHSLTQLETMISHITQAEATYRYPTYLVVPESLEQLVVPLHIRLWRHLLLLLAMVNLGVSTAVLITMGQQGTDYQALGAWPAVSLGTACVLFWLAHQLMRRKITYHVLLAVVGVALVSMPVVGTLQDLFHLFGPYGLLETSGILTAIGLLIAPFLLFWFTRSALRTWLPRRGSWRLTRQRRPTLALPAWKQLWSGNVPYLLLSIGVAALLLTRISLVVPKPAVALSPEYFITEIPIHGGSSVPWLRGITKGTDGNLWFTSSSVLDGAIYRMAPTSHEITFPPTETIITRFLLPDLDSVVDGITTGPDGNLWFSDLYFVSGKTTEGKSAIGRITPTGSIKKFPIPGAGSSPGNISQGPDSNLWFTESGNNAIGRITPAGVIAEFSLPTQGDPHGITPGPDGNLWFTESSGDSIGRITPEGKVTEFPLPTLKSLPSGITKGPDGNLWFTESSNNAIGRITPTGVISEFSLPTAQSGPNGITVGPDGNLWFTESTGNNIGRITPDGKVAEFPVPTAQSEPYGIAAGPGSTLWFTESQKGAVGVLDLEK